MAVTRSFEGSGHVMAGVAEGHRKLCDRKQRRNALLQGGRREHLRFMHTSTLSNAPFYSNGASARFQKRPMTPERSSSWPCAWRTALA